MERSGTRGEVVDMVNVCVFMKVRGWIAGDNDWRSKAASYVGAVRATSVVMGALMGWLLLKEKFGAVRVFAAATMVAGLLLVAMA